jgi:hypothetical protein
MLWVTNVFFTIFGSCSNFLKVVAFFFVSEPRSYILKPAMKSIGNSDIPGGDKPYSIKQIMSKIQFLSVRSLQLKKYLDLKNRYLGFVV